MRKVTKRNGQINLKHETEKYKTQYTVLSANCCIGQGLNIFELCYQIFITVDSQ